MLTVPKDLLFLLSLWMTESSDLRSRTQLSFPDSYRFLCPSWRRTNYHSKTFSILPFIPSLETGPGVTARRPICLLGITIMKESYCSSANWYKYRGNRKYIGCYMRLKKYYYQKSVCVTIYIFILLYILDCLKYIWIKL